MQGVNPETFIANLENLNKSYEECMEAKLACAKAQEEKRIALAKLEESVAQINEALKRLLQS